MYLDRHKSLHPWISYRILQRIGSIVVLLKEASPDLQRPKTFDSDRDRDTTLTRQNAILHLRYLAMSYKQTDGCQTFLAYSRSTLQILPQHLPNRTEMHSTNATVPA